MFDEQPDGDPHGECAAYIGRLESKLRAIFSHWNEFGPEHGFGELMDRLQPDGVLQAGAEYAALFSNETVVTQTDANNYCRILTLLGLEEEGDPVAEIERLLATAAPAPLPTSPKDEQLMKFYGVSTLHDLVDAQAYHIEKLQAKLPPTPSLAPQRVREG